MSDFALRQAARRWTTEQSGEAAIAYLGALSRRGLLPDHEPTKHAWGEWEPARFGGNKQRNAAVRTAEDGTMLLRSYSTVVAAFVPGVGMLWSPDEAHSVTSSRHVSRWQRELNYPTRHTVSAEDLARAAA